MAKQFLHGDNIDVIIEQITGNGVPDNMERTVGDASLGGTWAYFLLHEGLWGCWGACCPII
jgi:hypothetical protein